jgi:50S ribosomal protein L16 3-hydroxylase
VSDQPRNQSHRYNQAMKNHTVLGSMSTETFLRTYWQKKPLLIRQAIPSMQPVLSRESLFELAAQDDVESRLISQTGTRWRMQHGPIVNLPSTRKKQWTLLVQGVDLHDDRAADLLGQFRFIPDARLDDLMISYASDQGGVGAHFDSYDVFLLQAHGQRRWRIGAQQDLTLKAGLPLKVLENFSPEQEFVLDPGDMLYLPPHYAHEGVAIGECMTYSIGFRAPSWQELGQALLQYKEDTLELTGRYSDRGLKPTNKPAQINDDLFEKVSTELQRISFSKDDLHIFLGEYLSSPKSSVIFEPLARTVPSKKFVAMLKKAGLKLHRKTRMLYRGKYLFVNGESFLVSGKDLACLKTLADQRFLRPESIANASQDLIESLNHWYNIGWLAALDN